MACLSGSYLTRNDESTGDQGKAESVLFDALIFSIRLDLTALLIANDKGMDRLPVLTLSEARA